GYFTIEGSDAFEFSGLPAGSYTLVVEWLEGEDRYTARQPLVVGNSDFENLRVTVAKGAPIAGTIRIRGPRHTSLRRVARATRINGTRARFHVYRRRQGRLLHLFRSARRSVQIIRYGAAGQFVC